MSHENSITVGVDGRFVNLHTSGRTAAEAITDFRKTGRSLGNKTFATKSAALRAAESRSRNFKTPRRNPFRGVRE